MPVLWINHAKAAPCQTTGVASCTGESVWQSILVECGGMSGVGVEAQAVHQLVQECHVLARQCFAALTQADHQAAHTPQG